MKDYAFDTEAVKQGLLTLEYLENAFFQLTGEFDDYQLLPDQETTPDGNLILDNSASRELIELESDKNVLGLLNSPASRSVFLEIVSKATTTGFLALAVNTRNTQYAYVGRAVDDYPGAAT
jgi:hypothetical protein